MSSSNLLIRQWLCCIFILLSSLNYAQAYHFYNPNAVCGDFLRQLDHNAPNYFKLDRCDVNNEGQGKLITATYKIEGKYTKQALHYLTKKMGIDNKLVFMCCYWGSKKGDLTGSFINPKDNTLYRAGFASEETLSKIAWEDIIFYLHIEVAREDI